MARLYQYREFICYTQVVSTNFLDNLGFSDKKPKHYHGDIVRVLFLVIAFLMFVGLPFFQDEIPLPLSLSLGAVVFLVFLGGLTNPRQAWVVFLDTVVSLLGLSIFAYFSVTRFSSLELTAFFLINQTLGLLFLVAFYFSTKTLRGMYLREK